MGAGYKKKKKNWGYYSGQCDQVTFPYNRGPIEPRTFYLGFVISVRYANWKGSGAVIRHTPFLIPWEHFGFLCFQRWAQNYPILQGRGCPPCPGVAALHAGSRSPSWQRPKGRKGTGIQPAPALQEFTFLGCCFFPDLGKSIPRTQLNVSVPPSLNWVSKKVFLFFPLYGAQNGSLLVALGYPAISAEPFEREMCWVRSLGSSFHPSGHRPREPLLERSVTVPWIGRVDCLVRGKWLGQSLSPVDFPTAASWFHGFRALERS